MNFALIKSVYCDWDFRESVCVWVNNEWMEKKPLFFFKHKIIYLKDEKNRWKTFSELGVLQQSINVSQSEEIETIFGQQIDLDLICFCVCLCVCFFFLFFIHADFHSCNWDQKSIEWIWNWTKVGYSMKHRFSFK